MSESREHSSCARARRSVADGPSPGMRHGPYQNCGSRGGRASVVGHLVVLESCGGGRVCAAKNRPSSLLPAVRGSSARHPAAKGRPWLNREPIEGPCWGSRAETVQLAESPTSASRSAKIRSSEIRHASRPITRTAAAVSAAPCRGITTGAVRRTSGSRAKHGMPAGTQGGARRNPPIDLNVISATAAGEVGRTIPPAPQPSAARRSRASTEVQGSQALHERR